MIRASKGLWKVKISTVAMLTDFGLSRSRERHGAAVNTVLGGSYPYLAPEAFRHNAITEVVDIYSFGIMLLEIATLDALVRMAPYQITMEVAVDKKRPRIPITANSRVSSPLSETVGVMSSPIDQRQLRWNADG